MNSLLVIRDTSQVLNYIPTNSIQDVRRTAPTEVTIYTNIPSYLDATAPEVLCYTLYETGSGGGAADTTEAQAILDAWATALQGKNSTITVALPFPISRIDHTSIAW